jgi:predicted Rossmann fold nucleotide-binding protein DprA/Smf involved in DNA uptake
MTAARLSDDTLATVLVCAGLGAQRGAATPLSHKEWNGLVRSLIRASWRPGDLMRWGVAAAREALALDVELADRLDDLLGQAVLVAAELERLTGAGIGVLSRADESYPTRWRSRLREQAPPLLFVAGPASLLERGGIAAVGSRDVDDTGAAFARAVGHGAARTGSPMISGGARGVDREAMFGSLEAGGEAVGIMPDGLGRALRSPDVRRSVAEEQLVLVSPHRPDAGFKIWRAMDRNKLIYALADVAIVISSDEGRGGTWAGATENLRNDWSPLFVRAGNCIPGGNRRLIELGALPLSDSDLEDSPGELLTLLLARAERESGKRPSHPAQQSLLDGVDEDFRGPTSRVHNGQLAVQEEPLQASLCADQLELLKEN